jgi:hypothetical protein
MSLLLRNMAANTEGGRTVDTPGTVGTGSLVGGSRANVPPTVKPKATVRDRGDELGRRWYGGK